MDNSIAEDFLATFNKMEKWLSNEVGDNGHGNGYSSLLSKMYAKNAIIRKHFNELKIYGSLRNLMVHEKTNPDSYVTYPSPEIVERFKNIYEELTEPPLVVPKFQRQVATFDVSNPLSEILKIVREENYTNFPVYENREFKGLLTDNGLTNWLSNNVEEDLISILDTSIADVMPMEEETDNYVFIDRNRSVYDARDLFEKHPTRLDAILITQNGKQSEKLLGIITSWDVIELLT